MAKSKDYFTQRDQRNIERTKIIQKDLPPLATSYLQVRGNDMTTYTQLMYAYDLQMFFRWWHDGLSELKDRPISSMDADDLVKITSQDIYDYMQSDVCTGCSRSTLSRRVSTISSFFTYLFRSGIVPANPCYAVYRPKREKDKRIIRLTDEEIIRYLSAVRNGTGFPPHQQEYLKNTRDRDNAIVTLMLMSGVRVSECVGLDIDDISFAEKRISITRKGGKKQYIPLSEDAIIALKIYLAIREHITPPDPKDEHALFLSSQRRRITPAAVENMTVKYAKAVGITKKITPHKLRKTFGTNLYNQTGDIYLVASALGHENVNTTTEHYVEQNYSNLQNAIKDVHIPKDDKDEP